MADKRVFRCPRCNNLLTASQTKRLLKWNWVLEGDACRTCGLKDIDIYSVGVDILPSSERFFVDETVYKTLWHHTTARKNWIHDVLTHHDKPAVHLGTYYAARARAVDTRDDYREDMKWRYVVRLDRDATIDPVVQNDIDEWGISYEEYNYDITRYINRFESPGSVSLLVNPRKIKIVKRIEVTEREMRGNSTTGTRD